MNAEDPFLRALTGDGPESTITLERSYRVPADELWNALTTPERVARWYGTIVGRVPRAPGDRFEVDLGGGMIRRAVLERCDAPVELVYTWWSGDGDPGLVRLRLDPLAPDVTRLSVQHDRLRPHRMAQYGGGWEANLVTLAGVVAGEPAGAVEDRGARWELLRAHPLHLELSIDAPAADVWKAWSGADALASWWWTHWDDVSVAADVRDGGAYRIDAARHGITVSGEYLVVEPERRLAFTWVWTDDEGSTRDEAVDVSFRTDGGTTTLVLRHTGPWDSSGPADSYREGWDFVLGELSRRLA